jgi:hypothetical protein
MLITITLILVILAPRRPAEKSRSRQVTFVGAADRSSGLGCRQVTITIGELEPEFVSYATLRRHTFCFKGMKRCEFDHDPTDSRAPPNLTPAPRTVTCSTVVRSSARSVVPSPICICSLISLVRLLRTCMIVASYLCYLMGSLGTRHTFCMCDRIHVSLEDPFGF